MRIENLVLYATNTGEMYRGNCDLARRNASFDDWHKRTLLALRRYRVELREPHEGMSEVDLTEATRQLKAHYMRHIAEGA